MTKLNLHTKNNTTGGVYSYSPTSPRTTIIADSVHSGLAFFVSKNSMQEDIMINSGCIVSLSTYHGDIQTYMPEQGKKAVLRTLAGL